MSLITITDIGKKINECGQKYVQVIVSFVNPQVPPLNPNTPDPIWNKVIRDVSTQPNTKCVNIVDNSSVDIITNNDNFEILEKYFQSVHRCQLLAKSSSPFQKNQTFSCVGEMNDFLINIVNREIKK